MGKKPEHPPRDLIERYLYGKNMTSRQMRELEDHVPSCEKCSKVARLDDGCRPRDGRAPTPETKAAVERIMAQFRKGEDRHR